MVSAPWVPALGVYAGPGGLAQAQSFNAASGGNVSYALDFVDDGSWTSISDPYWTLAHWAGTPFHMIYGIPMLPNQRIDPQRRGGGRLQPGLRQPRHSVGRCRPGQCDLDDRLGPAPVGDSMGRALEHRCRQLCGLLAPNRELDPLGPRGSFLF